MKFHCHFIHRKIYLEHENCIEHTTLLTLNLYCMLEQLTENMLNINQGWKKYFTF